MIADAGGFAGGSQLSVRVGYSDVTTDSGDAGMPVLPQARGRAWIGACARREFHPELFLGLFRFHFYGRRF